MKGGAGLTLTKLLSDSRSLALEYDDEKDLEELLSPYKHSTAPVARSKGKQKKRMIPSDAASPSESAREAKRRLVDDSRAPSMARSASPGHVRSVPGDEKRIKQIPHAPTDNVSERQRGRVLSKSKRPEVSSSWAFEVDYNDHFETGLDAIQHIDSALSLLAQRMGKKKSDLCIYDPFFCKGGVVQHFNDLGYLNVINRNRDFYADVDNKQVPDYDILVTNPPYSLDHKERIVEFCVSNGKPWMLLMPNYVANKAYYSAAIQRYSQRNYAKQPSSSAASGKAQRKQPGQDQRIVGRKEPKPQPGSMPCYIVPDIKYEFQHPEGTGHASSPFFSIWFIHLGQYHNQHTLTDLQRLAHSIGSSSPVTPGSKSTQHKQGAKSPGRPAHPSSAGTVKIVGSVEELKVSGAAPAWKRPNPKQRKKMKKQKAGAA